MIKVNEDVKTRRRKKERTVKFSKMFTLSQTGDRKRRQPMKNRCWREPKVYCLPMSASVVSPSSNLEIVMDHRSQNPNTIYV